MSGTKRLAFVQIGREYFILLVKLIFLAIEMNNGLFEYVLAELEIFMKVNNPYYYAVLGFTDVYM